MKKPLTSGDDPLSTSSNEPPARPASGISGIRRLGDEAARDGWLDCQLRLTADLLHLRMRLETQYLGGARRVAWARRLLESLEVLKDALYEISADALAPPLAPLLTTTSALTREVRALYTWTDDVVAWLVLHLHGPHLQSARRSEPPPSVEALAAINAQIDTAPFPPMESDALPAMPSILRVVEEIELTLGADHPLAARAAAHVNEAYLTALSIDAGLRSARKDATEGGD